MGKEHTAEGQAHGSQESGRWKLMLKLPALRGKLQLLAARDQSIAHLFEAYDDACMTLQRLRKAVGESNVPMIREYEEVCLEIETDVIEYCLKSS